MVKYILHGTYRLFGIIFCRLLLIFTMIRDIVDKPKTKTILFVAHPDDDVLFFHSFIKKEKPYVVLLMTGWSFRRLMGFVKVMHVYGVRFRAYDLVSSQAKNRNERWKKRLYKQIHDSYKVGSFRLCATHNSEGEYGHLSHKLVHEAVVEVVKCSIVVPEYQEKIEKYCLPEEVVQEKEALINQYYLSENWVIQDLKLWVNCEHLKQQN